MQRTIRANLLLAAVASMVVCAAATGAVETPGTFYRPVANQSPEVGFTFSRLPDNPKMYSLIISEGEERSVSGNFSVEQLQVLRAIMAEAEKFGMTPEAVGTTEAVTTRFADKYQPAFIVDVQKIGNQSKLFLTIQTEIGRLTVEAGKIARATRHEDGFFFDLLSRLESVLPKQPAQPH